MPSRTEDMAAQGALITERPDLQQVIPGARREKFGVVARGFFDTSATTTLPAYPDGPAWDQNSRTGGRRYPMEVAYRAIVELSSREGGILTYGYGARLSGGDKVTPANFDEFFAQQRMQPEGDTLQIAEALRQAEQKFETEQAKKGPDTRPIKLDVILSGGSPVADLEDASAIRSAGQKHPILVCVFGYDRSEEDTQFTNTLLQWGRIAQELVEKDEYSHQHLWVVPFDDTQEADEISRTVQGAVS